MSERTRSMVSLSIRELLLITAIVALILWFVIFKKTDTTQRNKNSKALVSEVGPIEFRYWRQIGSNGSGSGLRGSGNEWRNAEGVDIFEDFIVIHHDNGLQEMMQREGLEYFDWRPRKQSSQKGAAPSSGH